MATNSKGKTAKQDNNTMALQKKQCLELACSIKKHCPCMKFHRIHAVCKFENLVLSARCAVEELQIDQDFCKGEKEKFKHT
jgi:hypothetical protein